MPEQKKDFSWTRLYALRAACSLARGNANREQQVADLVRTMAEDEDEPDVVSAAARARLASQGDRKSEARLRGELKNPDEFWLCLSAIRGLREFPVPRLADALLALLRENRYRDLVFQAIRALAREEYRSSVEVARGMADIVRLNPARHLRLEAVKALAVLQHRDTQNDLLRALADEDAEIRAQASAALAALLTVEEAVAAIVLEVLSDDLDPETWGRLVGGLRLVDITREISTRVLGAEIDGPDPERAKRAERTLTELGGGAALQRLTQRRRTLTDLDKVLKPALPI